MTTRLLPRIGLALTGLLALTPCLQAQPHKAKPHKPAPAHHAASQGWQPDPVLLKQLAPTYSLDAYTIRPPRGYQLEQKPVELDKVIFQIYEWKGPKRNDQSQPDFTIIVIAPQPGFQVTNDEKVLAYSQIIIQKSVTDYVHSPAEEGTIHDLDFARNYWKGTDHETSQRVHGFSYTCVDGLAGIIITGEDAEPYNKTTLALIEAAVKTLQRQ